MSLLQISDPLKSNDELKKFAVAAMMKNEGYNVIGITLKLYNDNKDTVTILQDKR